MVRKKLNMTLDYIIEYIEVKYHINIIYNKAWNVRTKAVTKLFGDWESLYEILPQYLNAMKISNSGIIIALYFEPYTYGKVWFHRAFLGFRTIHRRFPILSTLLSIDGIHLYEKYKGCLLIVTEVDANNGLFPLAFAIVEGEKEAFWQWFKSYIYHLTPVYIKIEESLLFLIR